MTCTSISSNKQPSPGFGSRYFVLTLCGCGVAFFVCFYILLGILKLNDNDVYYLAFILFSIALLYRNRLDHLPSPHCFSSTCLQSNLFSGLSSILGKVLLWLNNNLLKIVVIFSIGFFLRTIINCGLDTYTNIITPISLGCSYIFVSFIESNFNLSVFGKIFDFEDFSKSGFKFNTNLFSYKNVSDCIQF